jgi:peptidoglycan/xylan/chitin deacetylase (PgdA/CDA1 family)
LYSQNHFIIEKDIPVIYGTPEIIIKENTNKLIYCKTDIFADIFFMLTRWEENVISEKDEYGRFPEKISLSIRNGIHHRPVVNEYIEMLWKMLLFLGYSGIRKKMEFEPVITHDVDEVIRYKNIPKLIRIIAGDLVLRKKSELIPTSIKDYLAVKSGVKKDNYDTFDFLMDLSEKINVKSHFYFLSQKGGTTRGELNSRYDSRYNISDPKVVTIIQNIQRRGHFIGIHGSYNSYNNNDLFSDELNNLKEIIGDVSESRQHYLRFLPPATWEIESKNNIQVDSTLGFAEEIGFRCGTCYPYPVFDFINRKPLDLIELPLTVMEGAVLFLTKDPEDFYSRICSIIDTVKKFEGKFVFLWHTNTFNGYEWKPYQDYYTKIIDYLGSLSNQL